MYDVKFEWMRETEAGLIHNFHTMYRCPKRRCVIDLTISSDEDDYDFLDDISLNCKTTKDTVPVIDTADDNLFWSCVHTKISECCLHPVMGSRSFTSKCSDMCSCSYIGVEHSFSGTLDDQKELSYESAASARNLDSSASNTIPSSSVETKSIVWTLLIHDEAMRMFLNNVDLCRLTCCCNDFHVMLKPEVSRLNVLSLLVGLGYLSVSDNKSLVEKYRLGELQECMNPRCSAFCPSSTSFHSHCSIGCFLSYIPGCYKCFCRFEDVGEFIQDEYGYQCFPACSEELVSGEESEYNE